MGPAASGRASISVEQEGDRAMEKAASGNLRGAALFVPGPVEPWKERFDIGRLDGGSAPDAQAGGRRAVAGDVVGRAFLLEAPGHRPHGLKALLGREPGEPRFGYLELRRGAGDRGRVLGERI